MNIDRITTPLLNEAPRVRTVNISIWDILRSLASGKSEAEIIAEHPGLEHEDFLAVYGYAALKGEFSGLEKRMKEIQEEVKGSVSEELR